MHASLGKQNALTPLVNEIEEKNKQMQGEFRKLSEEEVAAMSDIERDRYEKVGATTTAACCLTRL